MPAFPERESSILALLKRKKPGRLPDTVEGKEDKSPAPSPINAAQVSTLMATHFVNIFASVLIYQLDGVAREQ